MLPLLRKPAALFLVLPLLACGSTPTPTELCQTAFDKKCTDDDDGDYTVSKCAEGAQSILDAASQRGASCREAVDRYFACVEDALDAIDQCTDDGDELDVCSNDDLACAILDDDDVR